MSFFGSSHFGLPRLKPLSSKRSHIVSVLDIGSTKVVLHDRTADAARGKRNPAGSAPTRWKSSALVTSARAV